ncbi:uncharacterized protein LOC129800679 [Phlebotomus papatasi]|uniref:uncharacterized protein LOC129800679 n=1 Tax=Phlebotomus papatasi TaxID=29031 RepID=UPI0024835DCA|nr:uncharacterized protein LOC129800679 [Phlebotomus papatasi]
MSAKIVNICVILLLTPAVLGRPQFVTFGKDGKVGVNFGGYHASAGLGGLLTGNAAHGGLSASAGTPYGQQAGAGLGGSVDGRTAGGLYAGASAGHGVGASAALAGNVEADGGGAGGSVAEAHATGLQKTVVQTVESQPPQVVTVDAPVVHHQPSLTVTKNVVATADAAPETTVGDTVVYHKIKTKKKFHTVPVQPAVVQQDTVVTPEQTIPTVQVQSQAPAAGVDYRKFLDFGFFANTAAGFGGAAQAPAVQPVQTVQTVQTVPAQPQHVVYRHRHHHHLKPAKRVHYQYVAAPQPPPVVQVEKRVYVPPPPTVQIHKTIQTAPAVVHKPVVVTRPVSSESSESSYSDSIESHELGSKTKTVTYTSGVHGGVHGHGGTFFDGVFGIPIATLTAVNQFLNGKAAGGGAHIQKSVTITKG